MIVNAVHWFNPFVYFVTRQINEECEVSCDLIVTQDMTELEKKGYMNTILTLLSENKSKKQTLTTAMASDKKQIKRRFLIIKKAKRLNRFTAFTSVITAVLILVTTVFASGVLANELLNNNYMIEVYKGENLLNFTNKPFMENNAVYLPLRETLEKTSVLGSKYSRMEWNNGTIFFTLDCGSNGSFPANTGAIITQSFMLKIDDIAIYRPEIYGNVYYDGGHVFSHMFHAPILKNGVTYVPYQFFVETRPHVFAIQSLSCKAYDKDESIIFASNSYPIKEEVVVWQSPDTFMGTAAEQDAYNPVDENGNKVLIDRYIVDEGGNILAFIPAVYQDPATIEQLCDNKTTVVKQGYNGLYDEMIFRNDDGEQFRQDVVLCVPNPETDNDYCTYIAFVPAEYQYKWADLPIMPRSE